jgi:hypothetical protein
MTFFTISASTLPSALLYEFSRAAISPAGMEASPDHVLSHFLPFG